MREIRSEIDIEAAPNIVWNILTNFNGWKEWNPIVIQASGEASSGATLSVTMVGPDGKDGKDGPKYMPIITNMEEPRNFRWRAKMMAGFIFTNDKVFELEETSSGTRLVHKELFSGIMVRMFWGKLNNYVPSMLNSMNEALKDLVEKNSD